MNGWKSIEAARYRHAPPVAIHGTAICTARLEHPGTLGTAVGRKRHRFLDDFHPCHPAAMEKFRVPETVLIFYDVEKRQDLRAAKNFEPALRVGHGQPKTRCGIMPIDLMVYEANRRCGRVGEYSLADGERRLGGTHTLDQRCQTLREGQIQLDVADDVAVGCSDSAADRTAMTMIAFMEDGRRRDPLRLEQTNAPPQRDRRVVTGMVLDENELPGKPDCVHAFAERFHRVREAGRVVVTRHDQAKIHGSQITEERPAVVLLRQEQPEIFSRVDKKGDGSDCSPAGLCHGDAPAAYIVPQIHDQRAPTVAAMDKSRLLSA